MESVQGERRSVPNQPHVTRRVLVAIPCYNEELAIGGVVLRAKKYAEEVLVIDDGSKDRTAEVAKLAGATVVVNEKNSGKGYGVRRAFRYAHDGGFDALVLIDGDGQHDADEIPLLLEPILNRPDRPVDVSLGFRFGDKTEMPMWRRVGKRVLDYATAAGGGGAVTDSQCGYRAFGKRAIHEMSQQLSGDGFSIESEQLVVMNSAGLAYDNVRIHCKYDGIDGSTKGPIAHAAGVLESLFETITEKRPMTFIGVPSVLAILAGLTLAWITLKFYSDHHYFLMAYALGAATLAILGAMGMLVAIMLKMIAHVEKRIARRN